MQYFGYNSVVPQPYQPQVTPFPQGAGYAIGAGANNLVSNLIAAALYKQNLEQQQQADALMKLQVLDRFGPGAYRAPGAEQLFQQANMPIMPNQIPMSKEEVDAIAMQELQKRYPGMTSAMIVEQMREQDRQRRLQEAWQRAGGFFGGGAQREQPAQVTEDFSIPGSKVGPQEPVTDQIISPPMQAPAGQVTRKMSVSAEGYPMPSVEIGPTPVSIQEQQAAEAAVAAAENQIIREARGGKKFYGPNGEIVSLPELAKLYKVSVTDLIKGNASDIARMKGHKLPAEAPSMEKIRAEHQRRVVSEQAERQFQITEKRLALESRRLDQLIANGNRAAEANNKQLELQMLNQARDTGKTIVREAREAIDRVNKEISDNLGKATPEQAERKRNLETALANAIAKLTGLTPSAGPEVPTPFQGSTGGGRSGYPSGWFKEGSQTPTAPSSRVPSTPEPEIEENEY